MVKVQPEFLQHQLHTTLNTAVVVGVDILTFRQIKPAAAQLKAAVAAAAVQEQPLCLLWSLQQLAA